ncbi:Predicted amino acid dehydrogenase [Devosia crocina]|uniref:Predicted amino acid dehydrogenase n=1 Tax=Devosia crocina TaxID=429728 RepID=A0A1I7NAG9_9HYPH|nr:polysaccharide biosynthesis protein [Devosia crocina]SFV31682.1 Predicted amino acid dehydrogenase [Devosia crocina]
MQSEFAFLVHPRNTLREDMGILFGQPFSLVPETVWRSALKHLPVPPMVTGKMSLLDAPGKVVGRIITVPLTPTQLLTMPRNQVQGRISQAIDKARDLGASVVGLGALTAPASVGGKAFAKRTDIGVTNGNAFTAAMTLQAIEKLVPTLGRDPLIAIVGATGSVGSCLTRLYARQHSGRLLLVARNEMRLQALASDVRRDGVEATISTDMADVATADLVVLLTSSPDALLRSEHLKPGAIVLDDTVPRNTDERLLTERPDVLIVDGGLVEVPGFHLRGSIALAPKLAYACLAETMLLALSGHKGHFCMGDAKVEQAEHILKLARDHQHLGFHLAPFRSFGRKIGKEHAFSAAIVQEQVSCAA